MGPARRLRTASFRALFTSALAATALAADDAHRTLEERLLEILRARGAISEAEHAELSRLAEALRTEEAPERADLEREIARYLEEAQDAAPAGFESGYAEGFYF